MASYTWASARTAAKAVTALTLALTFACQGHAQDAATAAKLQRIEEDWVVLVKNPDGKIASPQILICLSPDGKFDSDFALIELNHASKPNWFAGGVQLQGWKDDVNVNIFNSPRTEVLQRGYDRLRFTVVMEAKGDGKTTFGLQDGKSKTWGTFGTDPAKKIEVTVPSTRTDLAGYLRDHSLKNSHVTHGAHRVRIMYQRRVRYYYDDGTEKVDGSLKVQHRFQNLVEVMSLEEWEANKDYLSIEVTEGGE